MNNILECVNTSLELLKLVYVIATTYYNDK